jgi:hypothetical protein
MTRRLLWLHLLSRRTVRTVAVLAAVAAVLRVIEPWTYAPGAISRVLPLLLVAAAAAVIATATRSPFGEAERTGHLLPRLRLGHVLLLVALAAGVLALARTGDAVATARNLAGYTGIALLTAVAVGPPAAPITVLAYTVACQAAITNRDETVWTWPTLPGGDGTAMFVATAVLASGITALVWRGSRERQTDPA